MQQIIAEFIPMNDPLDEQKVGTSEDATEDFLYELYDHISPQLARELGSEASDLRVIRIAWRNTSRSATLRLFELLIDDIESGQKVLTAEDWAGQCTSDVLFDVFHETTGLGKDEARIAIRAAADAIISYGVLQTPQQLLFMGKNISLYVEAS